MVTHDDEISKDLYPFGFMFLCQLVQNKPGADIFLIQILVEWGVHRVLINVYFLRYESWS